MRREGERGERVGMSEGRWREAGGMGEKGKGGKKLNMVTTAVIKPTPSSTCTAVDSMV